jgi:hypothetical protein
MTVEAVSSSNTAAIAAAQQQKSAQAVQSKERENDSNKDDGAKAVKPPSQTVNTQGQTIGTTVNTTA